MSAKPDKKVILIKESLVQSLIADFATFGFLLLCIWASWKTDNLFWQFVLGTLGLIWTVARISLATDGSNSKEFRSFQEAHDWLGKQIGESQ